MCWEMETKFTIGDLKGDGIRFAHINGRGFYVDLENGLVLDKKNNMVRISGNPITASMLTDEVWEAYEPVKQKPLAPVVKLADKRPLFAVLDTEDGTIEATFFDENEANEYAESENELYGDAIYATVRYVRA